MTVIVGTIGAFCIASVALFFMHIAGVEYAQQFDTQTYAMYMIVSVVVLALGIAFMVYKKKKLAAQQAEEDEAKHSTDQPYHDPDDPYDFRPKSNKGDE